MEYEDEKLRSKHILPQSMHKRKKSQRKKRTRFKSMTDFSKALILGRFQTFTRLRYGSISEKLQKEGKYYLPTSNQFSDELVWRSNLQENFRNVFDTKKYFEGVLYGLGLAYRELEILLDRLKPEVSSKHIAEAYKSLDQLSPEQKKEMIKFFPVFESGVDRQIRKRMNPKDKRSITLRKLAKKLSLCLKTEIANGRPYIKIVADTLTVSQKEILDCLQYTRPKIQIGRDKKGKFLVE